MIRPQFGALHPRQVGAREAHPAEYIDLDDRIQSASGMSSKGFGSKMPRLLTRTSTSGWRVPDPRSASRSESPAKPTRSPPDSASERRDRLLNVNGRAAVDDHPRALTRERRRDGGADARGAARHQRPFAVEFEIHEMAYSRCYGRGPRAVWIRFAKTDPPSAGRAQLSFRPPRARVARAAFISLCDV